ncbi:hypothetical protein [Campylobacter troglodytis]|nr:hypothetical protein [Campylobacter troglodytis]
MCVCGYFSTFSMTRFRILFEFLLFATQNPHPLNPLCTAGGLLV